MICKRNITFILIFDTQINCKKKRKKMCSGKLEVDKSGFFFFLFFFGKKERLFKNRFCMMRT
ncbi:hypothetical protein HanIR_Chr10g0452081 [Helianthus annuus]|nr:hypothetical protein HanIR_Chr10g0452081 [Helianthus annuus]